MERWWWWSWWWWWWFCLCQFWKKKSFSLTSNKCFWRCPKILRSSSKDFCVGEEGKKVAKEEKTTTAKVSSLQYAVVLRHMLVRFYRQLDLKERSHPFSKIWSSLDSVTRFDTTPVARRRQWLTFLSTSYLTRQNLERRKRINTNVPNKKPKKKPKELPVHDVWDKNLVYCLAWRLRWLGRSFLFAFVRDEEGNWNWTVWARANVSTSFFSSVFSAFHLVVFESFFSPFSLSRPRARVINGGYRELKSWRKREREMRERERERKREREKERKREKFWPSRSWRALISNSAHF